MKETTDDHPGDHLQTLGDGRYGCAGLSLTGFGDSGLIFNSLVPLVGPVTALLTPMNDPKLVRQVVTCCALYITFTVVGQSTRETLRLLVTINQLFERVSRSSIQYRLVVKGRCVRSKEFLMLALCLL